MKFDSVLSAAQEQEKKSYNASGLLKKCEYEEIVNRMKELEKPEVRKTQKIYRLLRKYDIMEISVEGTTVHNQAEKMKLASAMRFKKAEVGDTNGSDPSC